jgi:putative nucleotidyltransferase with HDIG domain
MDGGLSEREKAALSALTEVLYTASPGFSDSDKEIIENESLAERLESLVRRARFLVTDDRRARQAAASYRAASLALSRSPDSNALLEELLDYFNWIVAYDAAQVFLVGSRGLLEARASREWRTGPRRPLDQIVEDMWRRAGDKTIIDEGVDGCVLCLPLRGPAGALGVALIVREGGRSFDEDEVRAAEAFAGQAAAALRSAALLDGLRRADRELLRSYDSSIEILSKALDLRDHETEGHSLRVASITTTLARAFGMDEESIALLRRGALLHDIGKIGIPDAILHKPGPLDEHERQIVRQHPSIARDLLEDVPFLRQAMDIPWCHHERWDGGGYPRGLRGEAIPFSARVFAVADVWDALTHDRPYRKALDEAATLNHIAAGSGSQFDPAVVQLFLGSFDLIISN